MIQIGCNPKKKIRISEFAHDGVSAFRFEVKTAGADTFQLPLEAGGTYDFNVDWGDGSESDITIWDHADTNHSYVGAGTYDVKITGTITGWRFNASADAPKLTEISRWGPLKFISTDTSAFKGCTGLTIISAPDVPDISALTTFGAWFQACSVLTEITNLTSWVTGSVTIWASFLQQCPQFNQSLLGLDISSGTDLRFMLFQSLAFDQDIGYLNISSVTMMGNFLTSVTMSTINYSNTLIGFQAQPHQDNVIFDGGASKRNAAGTVAYDLLVADGWTITDGGAE